MCTAEAKVSIGLAPPPLSKINGRPVLQPTCNRVPTLDRRNSLKLKKISSPPPSTPPPKPVNKAATTGSSAAAPEPPPSPKLKSPRPAAVKRSGGSDHTTTTAALNASSDKVVLPGPRINYPSAAGNKTPCLERKKSKSFKETGSSVGNIFGGGCNNSGEASLTYSSSLILDAPGSIAAVRREQMAFHHAQRKMKIAHYGRSKSAKFESFSPPDSVTTANSNSPPQEEVVMKRCSFITPNSDPIYVAYHDEEWGVPVHDDTMLFELLVLSGAQVGSDWTSILKKRQIFRDAFSGFEAETVANLTDKQMMSISTEYGIDISRVRGVVDNSNRILEVRKDFGSFDKYLWAFVNGKPISTLYKFGHKIPVKTSKSETISKDMVRRGFRFAGPTVVHSFMQAAGLTNDHLITCHKHLPCTLMAVAPTRPA